MQSRTISILGVSAGDEEAWRELAARSIEPNPFYEADFLVPACRHLRNGKNVMLLVATEGGRFHACLPVRTTNLPGRLYPPVTSSPVHSLYGSLGTPLVAPERAVEALRCLLATLSGDGWRRVVVLELFGVDGPIASFLRCAADELGLTVQTHALGERVLVRCQDENADRLPPSVKRERREKARQWRRLRADCGNPAVVDRAGEGDGATQFLAMEASGWKGRAGTALSSRTDDAAFYREVTARFASADKLRLYSLELAGKRLAMQTSFYANRALFVWKIAYDERFARYSPGAQLQLRVLELAQADQVQLIDTCADVADPHCFRLLSSDRRRIATLAIGGRGRLHDPLLTLAVALVKTSRKLRGVSRTSLRYKIVRWCRGKQTRLGQSLRRDRLRDRRNRLYRATDSPG